MSKNVIISSVGVQGPTGPQGEIGPQGPQGPAGSGGSGGTYYTHTQGSPVTTWTINHGLTYRPSVTVIQFGTTQIIEGEVIHTNENSCTVTFSTAISGNAYLS